MIAALIVPLTLFIVAIASFCLFFCVRRRKLRRRADRKLAPHRASTRIDKPGRETSIPHQNRCRPARQGVRWPDAGVNGRNTRRSRRGRRASDVFASVLADPLTTPAPIRLWPRDEDGMAYM